MPNLEELEITIKDVTMIPEYICRKLKVLHLSHDESASGFPVEDFHILKELHLDDTSYKEIFPYEELVNAAETSSLEPCTVSNLENRRKHDSFLQNLEILKVWSCHRLLNLLPSSASFGNLTTLEVWNCDKLINLVTSSTAKSLVRLQTLRIQSCIMMAEIVADDQGVVSRDDEIIFTKLMKLELEYLPRLTSFCSGNRTLKFPSLEYIRVRDCSEMKFFSQGVLSTPRLQHIFAYYSQEKCWEGDLNRTIQKLHERKVQQRERER